ncbi:MAG: hypothetical protein H0U14_06385 [Thermoleophilaceae bacterium]|nr:hypothetical protein [Thermoleophilaceae bacterium]
MRDKRYYVNPPAKLEYRVYVIPVSFWSLRLRRMAPGTWWSVAGVLAVAQLVGARA